MKKFADRYGFLLLIAGIVILLDQISKFLVRDRFEIWEGAGPWRIIGLDVYLVHMPNTGMMLGIMEGAGLVITIIGLVVTGVLVYYFPKISPDNWPARWGMGLLLGGIVGNLIDRIFIGYITDFLLIDPLPVVNLADIAVYTGVILLAAGVLIDSRRKSPKSPPVPGLKE